MTFISRQRTRPRRVSSTVTDAMVGVVAVPSDDPPLLLEPVEPAAETRPHEPQFGGQLARARSSTASLQCCEHVEPAQREVPLGAEVGIDRPLERGGDGLQFTPRRHSGRVESGHGVILAAMRRSFAQPVARGGPSPLPHGPPPEVHEAAPPRQPAGRGGRAVRCSSANAERVGDGRTTFEQRAVLHHELRHIEPEHATQPAGSLVEREEASLVR